MYMIVIITWIKNYLNQHSLISSSEQVAALPYNVFGNIYKSLAARIWTRMQLIELSQSGLEKTLKPKSPEKGF